MNAEKNIKLLEASGWFAAFQPDAVALIKERYVKYFDKVHQPRLKIRPADVLPIDMAKLVPSYCYRFKGDDIATVKRGIEYASGDSIDFENYVYTDIDDDKYDEPLLKISFDFNGQHFEGIGESEFDLPELVPVFTRALKTVGLCLFRCDHELEGIALGSLSSAAAVTENKLAWICDPYDKLPGIVPSEGSAPIRGEYETGE